MRSKPGYFISLRKVIPTIMSHLIHSPVILLVWARKAARAQTVRQPPSIAFTGAEPDLRTNESAVMLEIHQ